ncbi:MAG: hypothetical protein QOE55_4012, partial [Acidobacteriaceae bacterium]|nr:hypothetical protein [Acidobacteriaceae bacterium]
TQERDCERESCTQDERHEQSTVAIDA